MLTPVELLLLSVVVLAAVKLLTRNKIAPLPPGPPGLPIIGNVLDIPATDVWLQYMKWSEEYKSDVIYLNLLGKPYIILNSLAACKELLENRSSIYSSRPVMPMMNDLIGYEWNFGFMPYNEEWRERRKLFMHAFRPNKAQFYRASLVKQNRNFLLRLLDDPEHFIQHSRLAAGAFTLEVAYGIEVKSPDDVYITQAQRALLGLSASGTAATYIVDLIPSLKYLPSWFPGAGFKREALAWRPHVDAMLREPFEFLERAMENENAKPCVATELLEALADKSDPKYGRKKRMVQEALGSIYVGGADTTVSATSTFFLAMAQHPAAQKKCQTVIDEVVKTKGRLPDFAEYRKLPYIEAVVREVFRWRPVAPTGAPHSVIEDDTYKGLHIPRGATIIPNCFAITRDSTLYGPNVDQFDPSRFLDPTQKQLRKDAPSGLDTFGFGRRQCAGQEIAVETLWLVVTSVLAVFNITMAREPGDSFGKYSSAGMIIHPLPFNVTIVPRSDEAVGLIRGCLVATF